MLGSELCLRKEHMHRIRMIEVPSVEALFYALDVSLRKKKHATCTIFSAFCTKPNDLLCCKRPRQSLYINLFHSLSPSDRFIFRNSLPLFGAGILEKKTSTSHSTLCVCQRVSRAVRQKYTEHRWNKQINGHRFPPKITCVRNFRNSLFQKRAVFDFLGCFKNYFR